MSDCLAYLYVDCEYDDVDGDKTSELLGIESEKENIHMPTVFDLWSISHFTKLNHNGKEYTLITSAGMRYWCTLPYKQFLDIFTEKTAIVNKNMGFCNV